MARGNVWWSESGLQDLGKGLLYGLDNCRYGGRMSSGHRAGRRYIYSAAKGSPRAQIESGICTATASAARVVWETRAGPRTKLPVEGDLRVQRRDGPPNRQLLASPAPCRGIHRADAMILMNDKSRRMHRVLSLLASGPSRRRTPATRSA